jgi:hypothetical protein
MLDRQARVMLIAAVAETVLAGVLTALGANAVLTFVVSAI